MTTNLRIAIVSAAISLVLNSAVPARQLAGQERDSLGKKPLSHVLRGATFRRSEPGADACSRGQSLW